MITLNIHLSLRQFLFDVNWISIHGDILKRRCACHHASEADSTHISEQPSHLFRILVYQTILCESK